MRMPEANERNWKRWLTSLSLADASNSEQVDERDPAHNGDDADKGANAPGDSEPVLFCEILIAYFWSITHARCRCVCHHTLVILNISTYLTIMAQGQVKGMQKAKSSSSRHSAKAAAAPKKGRRYAAPKKVQAMKTAALHKVCR